MSPEPTVRAPSTDWWRDAVFYQIYVRSFADGNGDGVGDLPGIRRRLGYLADLGVDALWITPFFPSPMADHGYDVADPRDVEPVFGDLAEFDALLAEAHALGIRVTIDLVPNHSSDQHEWFRAALAAGIRLAAAEGARLVCLQELTLSPYFAVDPGGPQAVGAEPEDLPGGPTHSFAAAAAAEASSRAAVLTAPHDTTTMSAEYSSRRSPCITATRFTWRPPASVSSFRKTK